MGQLDEMNSITRMRTRQEIDYCKEGEKEKNNPHLSFSFLHSFTKDTVDSGFRRDANLMITIIPIA